MSEANAMTSKACFTVNPITGEKFYHGFRDVNMKELYASRQPYTPKLGYFYLNQGDGATYKCIAKSFSDTYVFQNVRSKWTFEAHGIGMYKDLSIDWDYSTNGFFKEES
jgi:hypothetical protein